MSSMSAPNPDPVVRTAQLGALVRDRRERLGLSMAELADRARLSRSSVHRVEHGSDIRPTPSKLARVLAVLSIDDEAVREVLPADEYRDDLLRWMAAAPAAESLADAAEAARLAAPDLVLIHPDGTMAQVFGGEPHLDALADAVKRAGWMVTRPA